MKLLYDKTGWTPEQWQKFRKSQKGIGGSDVAVILGISPFKSAFSLWLEKTGQVPAKELTSEAVEWGNILEPVIRDKFRIETGFEVEESPYVMGHDEYDFMLANVDGIVIDESGEKGILEIKTTDARNKAQWEFGPPDYYMCQVMHYLAVTDYPYAYVCVLIGGNHFKYFKIERNDYIIDKLIQAESKFWDMVENKIPPEITHMESDSEWLADAYPSANNMIVELSPVLELAAHRYLEISAEIKQLSNEAELIKNLIKQEAKENEVLQGEKIRIKIPTVRKISFDTKKFEEEHPDFFKQYKTKESSFRSFYVSLLEDK
jgi:putative phage-type endonuclease